MQRRRFLEQLGLGVGIAGAGGFVSCTALAEGAGKVLARRDDELFAEVKAAHARALASGRPLLAFVIPAQQAAIWERGSAFGQLLNHGGHEALAPLALCELAAATPGQLARLGIGGAEDEPLMLLLLPDATEGEPLRGKLPVPRELERPPAGGDFQAWQRAQDRAYDEAVDARIALLSGLVRDALLPDDAALERLAAAVRGRDPQAAAAMDAALAGSAPPSPELCARAGAVALLAAGRGSVREPIVAALAAIVGARYVAAPVAGSYWASSSGCGTRVEGIEDDGAGMVACGMGHVPARGQRFLRFLAPGEKPFRRATT